MKKSKQIKVLTSTMLGTVMVIGGMLSPVLASNNDVSRHTEVSKNKVERVWVSKDHLTQQYKIPYNVGDIVVHGSSLYECKRFHYSQPGWNPNHSKMFWRLVSNIPTWNAQEELTQEHKTPYKKGDVVMYNEKVYKCKRFHYAQPGWNPSDAKMFWKLVK